MSMARAPRSAEPIRDFSGWDSVTIEVDEIVKNNLEPFDPNTVANVKDLLSVCRDSTALPADVSKGYWNTVSLSWDKFEIEVFEDRLEVYRFYDQRSEIWYEEHRPGEPFTPRFLAELASLSMERGSSESG
jgi:hypothetical protein